MICHFEASTIFRSGSTRVLRNRFYLRYNDFALINLQMWKLQQPVTVSYVCTMHYKDSYFPLIFLGTLLNLEVGHASVAMHTNVCINYHFYFMFTENFVLKYHK